MTIHEAVADARRRLRAAGIPDDEAALDARLLAEHVLGWDTARLLSAGGDAPAGHFADRYDAFVARRAAREPVAYLTLEREFWNLTFEVSPAVLIPRPETELLVESAIERLAGRTAGTRVADVCTGSGCVAIALAVERPDLAITALDISPAALTVAARNASRHRVAARVPLAPGDLLATFDGTLDLIVANPPYVPDEEYRTLQPEVREHEPALALVGGPDGLAVIRVLVGQAARRLTRGGTLIFEFGWGQASEVERLISETVGLRMVAMRPDLQGIPRAALAERV